MKTLEDLRSHIEMFQHVGNSSLVANMTLENLLALMKCAAPRPKGWVSAERVCHSGHLSMHMRSHLEKGKPDCRIYSRARAQARGVPLKPNRQLIPKHSLKGQHQVRHHLAHLNKRRVEFAAQRPDLTAKERTRYNQRIIKGKRRFCIGINGQHEENMRFVLEPNENARET